MNSSPMHLIPMPLMRLIGLVLFAEAAYFLAWYARNALRAARRTDISDPALRRGAVLVSFFIAAWFAVSVVLGDGANFPLADESQRQIWSALPLFVFMIPALVWAFNSRTGKTLLAGFDPDALIRVQGYRVAGIFFLFPLMAFHALPAEFAVPAGIGDVLTGLFAPFIANAIEERRPGAYARAIVWNLFGMLDLIVAVGTAVHSKAPILAMYPLSLVPLFLGPPMGLMTHILSLRSLKLHRAEIERETEAKVESDRSSPLPVR